MLGFLLIVLFIGLFWLFRSLNANGGTRSGDSGSSADSDYIPGVTDGLVPYSSDHHSGDTGDPASPDSDSADAGHDSSH